MMQALQVIEDVRSTLPRGRHALSPREVRAAQRIRLLRAMIDEVAEHGFAATTAAGVYRRAGVSSRAFYENFSDVRECFLAAYDASVRVMQAAVRAPRPGDAGEKRVKPLDRFGEVLDTYLNLLASQAAVARTFLLEVYGAGSEARQRRVEVHDQFVAGVRDIVAPRRRLTAADEFALESLVDAITFRVTRALISGETRDLPKLRDQLIGLAIRLCPWLRASGAGP